ncbi:hypothetical protein L596_019654 [Steinernema carpocapsae]|uniref:Uncharacterized protein n=1 Tax=Steinernema carpocapsae TaxID=34508 RepID=A0A4U5MRN5_STECR|nr:hypothetical protein L596_019654 [Steinernema carpocapsae]
MYGRSGEWVWRFSIPFSRQFRRAEGLERLRERTQGSQGNNPSRRKMNTCRSSRSICLCRGAHKPETLRRRPHLKLLHTLDQIPALL